MKKFFKISFAVLCLAGLLLGCTYYINYALNTPKQDLIDKIDTDAYEYSSDEINANGDYAEFYCKGNFYASLDDDDYYVAADLCETAIAQLCKESQIFSYENDEELLFLNCDRSIMSNYNYQFYRFDIKIPEVETDEISKIVLVESYYDSDAPHKSIKYTFDSQKDIEYIISSKNTNNTDCFSLYDYITYGEEGYGFFDVYAVFKDYPILWYYLGNVDVDVETQKTLFDFN